MAAPQTGGHSLHKSVEAEGEMRQFDYASQVRLHSDMQRQFIGKRFIG